MFKLPKRNLNYLLHIMYTVKCSIVVKFVLTVKSNYRIITCIYTNNNSPFYNSHLIVIITNDNKLYKKSIKCTKYKRCKQQTKQAIESKQQWWMKREEQNRSIFATFTQLIQLQMKISFLTCFFSQSKTLIWVLLS